MRRSRCTRRKVMPANNKRMLKMSEKSKVYFAGVRARHSGESKIKKIAKLFDKAGFKDTVKKDALYAIKLHFGERGNDTFTNPIFAAEIVKKLKEAGAKPFLTDTNTLYKGSRHNAIDHMVTALEHGFSYATVGAPVIIADGLKSHGFVDIEINKKHFKSVKIAESIANADGMLVLSHFKGHQLAGFGGAIKNLAMGCSPARGKKEQHEANFKVNPESCTTCGRCIANCPEDAISWVTDNGKKHASIDSNPCIGCGECVTMCNFNAIVLGDWEKDIHSFTERMTEYALGAAECQQGKIAYINLLLNVTPECDCAGWSDAPLVPDIGILASTDPVALDKACFDLVNEQLGFQNSLLTCNHERGLDKFKGASSATMGEIQFQYAESIGMGSTEYELIEI